MRPLFKLLFLFVLTLNVASANDRTLLTTTSINDLKERDILKLPNCEGNRNAKTTHIKIKVNRYRIDLYKLKVTFQNGDNQELYARKHFKKGSTSEWLELVGGPRCVRKISITADADILGLGLRKKAHVSFYGKK
jgi:hypothetical protein